MLLCRSANQSDLALTSVLVCTRVMEPQMEQQLDNQMGNVFFK